MHKEVASLARRSDSLIINPVDDVYHVSDTHFLVVMEEEGYQTFRSKYNSYKTTTDIPGDINECILIRNKEVETTDTNTQVILQVDDHKPTRMTEYIKIDDGRDLWIYEVGDEYGFIDRKYEIFIGENAEVKSSGPLNPLMVCHDGKIKAAIMPVRDLEGVDILC